MTPARTFLALLLGVSVRSAFAQSCNNNASIADAYTPKAAACPTDFELVRSATVSYDDGTTQQTLNEDELEYIEERDTNILPDAWSTYLANVLSSIDGVELSDSLPDYVSDILTGSCSSSSDDASTNGDSDDDFSSVSTSYPRLGIAVSGGGYRAATFGAGVLNALDGRNDSAVAIGTGGLLQTASYLTGLSGGSWLVTSAVQSGFGTIQEVVFGPSGSPSSSDAEDGTNGGYGGWNANFDLTQPSNDTNTLNNFFATILAEMAGKYKAGYPVTFDDFWTRLLSRHFANGTYGEEFFDECSTLHGAGITWSQVANQSSFQNYQVPFPIIVANVESPKGDLTELEEGDFIPLTNLIYEFTPFETGSFDPSLSSFVPTQYLGSVNSSVCVTGYDQIALVTGTSSALFNEYNSSAAALASSSVAPLFALVSETFPQSNNIELDAVYIPNPFLGVNSSDYVDSNEQYLRLVDGGEDGEVIPLQPLLVQARGVDTIIAIDASADLNDSFTGGASMIATKNRTTLFPDIYAFPTVPDTVDEFVGQDLTTSPTFFGCNDTSPIPLVIYIANGAPARGQDAITNTSTLQTTYSDSELHAFIDQTFDIATQGIPIDDTNASDPEFAACLACAVVDRSRAALGYERSGICSSCFDNYCWYPSQGNDDASDDSGS